MNETLSKDALRFEPKPSVTKRDAANAPQPRNPPPLLCSQISCVAAINPKSNDSASPPNPTPPYHTSHINTSTTADASTALMLTDAQYASGALLGKVIHYSNYEREIQ